MRKNYVLKVVSAAFYLVILGGISNAIACDFSEGPDENIQQNKVVLSSSTHTNQSIEAMSCEGIPYNDKEDRVIIASSRAVYESGESMYSEGISFNEIEAVHMSNIRERALSVKPAAGSDK